MDYSEYIKALLITVDAGGLLKNIILEFYLIRLMVTRLRLASSFFSSLGKVMMINDHLGQRLAPVVRAASGNIDGNSQTSGSTIIATGE